MTDLPVPGAILFDLDDTLVDRRRSLARFAVTFRERFAGDLDGVGLDDLQLVIERAHGGGYRPKAEMVAELVGTLPWRTAPRADDLLTFWFTTFPRCAVGMDGLHEVAAALQARAIRLGILTNGSALAQAGKIETLGLRSYMDTIVISEEVGIKKPDRRIFDFAVAQLRLSPSVVWYVGDHPVNDIIGAEAAGLSSVWLKGIHPWPAGHPSPRATLNAFREIVSLVDEVRHSRD